MYIPESALRLSCAVYSVHCSALQCSVEHTNTRHSSRDIQARRGVSYKLKYYEHEMLFYISAENTK